MSTRFLAPGVAAEYLSADNVFFGHKDCPFKGVVHPGDDRVLVITGENAAGKSFLFQLMAAEISRHGITSVTLSIRERTGAGTMEMSRLRRAFIYGDEEMQSTGATSARVVKSGFHNAGNENPGILMLDEPEMGLSDGYARALGELIGQTARKPEADGGMRDQCHGVVVVTHNRALVNGLIEGLRASPTFANLGDTPVDLNDWLKFPDRRTIADLESLQTIASERRKTTHRIIAEIKAAK